MTLLNRINFSKEDIGAEILPILTRGLYRDTLDSLREYIQNSIDADATAIEVIIDPDLVSVLDNGTGMSASVARQAIRLGVSDKNPKENVGFRGIGIYSSFNLCESLELFTKSAEEDTTYRLFFDFRRIRTELLEDQERRNIGHSSQLNLEQLLSESVFIESFEDGPIEKHGTMVIMEGLLPDVYYRINDWQEVETYLQNVVPLPFDPEFRFAESLRSRFEERDYRVVPVTLEMGGRRQPIYRPYTNNVFRHGGKHDPEIFEIKDGRHDFGFAWVCVNDARETIKDRNIRGLLVKKFGFSIGDRSFLEPYFGRTVYSRRITGEVIAQHNDLIPNAARNDFESSTTRQRFLEFLPRFTRQVDTWANKIQEEDRALEVLSEISEELERINKDLPKIGRDREQLLELNARLSELDRRLNPHKRRLNSIDFTGLENCVGLLEGCKRFVRTNLGAQRQSRRKVEQEVVRAIQRELLTPTVSVQERSGNAPTDLVSLLDNYGILESEPLRQFLRFMDDNVLKANLADDTYSKSLMELRDHLEETL